MRGDSAEAVSTLLLQQEGLRGLQVRAALASSAAHGLPPTLGQPLGWQRSMHGRAAPPLLWRPAPGGSGHTTPRVLCTQPPVLNPPFLF